MIRVPILPELQQVIDRSPTGDLTLLVTEAGRPFSVKGAANKFKDWCVEAGLPHCSAHGVRKAAATVAAERGATEAQLMAIFNWEDAKLAVEYTRTARRKKLGGDAMHLRSRRTDEKQNPPTGTSGPIGGRNAGEIANEINDDFKDGGGGRTRTYEG